MCINIYIYMYVVHTGTHDISLTANGTASTSGHSSTGFLTLVELEAALYTFQLGCGMITIPTSRCIILSLGFFLKLCCIIISLGFVHKPCCCIILSLGYFLKPSCIILSFGFMKMPSAFLASFFLSFALLRLLFIFIGF